MATATTLPHAWFAATIYIWLCPVPSFGYEGNPGCPCIETNHSLNAETNELDIFFSGIVNGTDDVECAMGSIITYPSNYGLRTCRSWDAGLKPYCQDSGDDDDDDDDELYCGREWCYVNATICRASNISYYQSSFLGCNFYYSYHTCRESGDFVDHDIVNGLQGKTLTVGIPSLKYPEHYRLDSDGEVVTSTDVTAGQGEYLGMFIDFLNEVAGSAGYALHYDYVSGGSLAHQSSRWTACVEDVEKGVSDQCVGNFWETSARRSMSTFSASIVEEKFFLVVRTPNDEASFSHRVSLIFQPFSPALWGMILVAACFTGAIYSLLDVHAHRQFKKDEERLKLEHDPLCANNGCTEKGNMELKFVLKLWAARSYRAIYELLSGAPLEFERRSTAQKLIVVAWGFFIVAILAAFTANLAAFLTLSNASFDFTGIEDCVAVNCKLCVYSSFDSVLGDTFEALYPTQGYTIYSSRLEVAEAVRDNDCDAGILGDMSFYQQEELWLDCDITLIGDAIASSPYSRPRSPHFLHITRCSPPPILAPTLALTVRLANSCLGCTVPVGWPVSSTYVTSISYHIAKLKESGVWESIQASYMPDYSCTAAEAEEASETTQLGITEMSGPLLLLLATGFISVVIHTVDQSRQMGPVSSPQRRGRKGRKGRKGQKSAEESAPTSPAMEMTGMSTSAGLEDVGENARPRSMTFVDNPFHKQKKEAWKPTVNDDIEVLDETGRRDEWILGTVVSVTSDGTPVVQTNAWDEACTYTKWRQPGDGAQDLLAALRNEIDELASLREEFDRSIKRHKAANPAANGHSTYRVGDASGDL